MTPRESDSRTRSRSIVFADDDDFILEAIAELLMAEQYEVHRAHDGLEALRLIRELKPSYVILDMVMPKLDGSRVCWSIRRDSTLRDTSVIAFSSISPQAFRDFPEMSADAYVAKGPIPIAFQNILKAIAFVDSRSQNELSAGIFGYDAVQPRQQVDELLQQRKHYANVLRALGAGVLELDKEGRILMATPEACELLGSAYGRILGETLMSFCPAPDRKVVQDLLGELLRATAPERCQALVRLGPTRIPLRFCAVVEDGECTGILVILESSGA
jgi:PAS domain S-box-containing protein